MWLDLFSNVPAGEGFLNLFVSLFLLTVMSVGLMWVSRKWMLHTRSFLLLCLIVSYVMIIGLNGVSFGKPNHTLSMASLTLPDRVFDMGFSLDPDLASLYEENLSQGDIAASNDRVTASQPIYWSGVIKSMACVAGVVWLCGTFFYLLKIAIDLIRIARFRRELQPAKEALVTEMCREIRSRLNLKTLPDLYCSSRIESPMTIGLFYPIIVLPEKLLHAVSREELLCILSHESGHIKHRDNLIGLFQRLFIALNWFNPVAYVISARYSLCREDICDDYAIQMIDNSTKYTTCLVNLAEKSCLISSFTPAIGLVGCKRTLSKRVKRILSKEKRMNSKLTRTKKWTVSGLCAIMIVCCTGIQTVFAQDYEAVGRRLRAAVAAGELTGDQARVMLGTLRRASKSAQGKEGQGADKEAAVKRVRAAIEAGDITPEQGRARLQAMKKGMAARSAEARKRQAKPRDPKAVYAAAEKEIQGAIKAGKITPQQGRAKLQGMKKAMVARAKKRQAKPRDPKAVYAAAEKEIQAAIKAGKITRAQGKERLAGLKRHLANSGDKPDAAGLARQRSLRAQYAAAEKRIQAAIKDGIITETQGKERMDALKKRLFESAKKKETPGEHDTAARTRQRNKRMEYAAAEKKVKLAIESGRVTESQGKERLAALKEHLFGDAEKAQTRGERGARGERSERRERTRRR